MGLSMRRDSPWLALTLLTAISTVGFIDRIVMNVLAVPIQGEFHLSDTQVGLLTGLAFAVLNVALGILVARYAERQPYSCPIHEPPAEPRKAPSGGASSSTDIAVARRSGGK